MRLAFRSKNYGSFRYDLTNEGPTSRQGWNVEELSILGVTSAKHMPKAALH
jgi:hypothetical protein